jgi:porphobilinogen synthase
LIELEEIQKLGIQGVLLFGVPHCKDETGSQAYDDNGIVQRALKAARRSFPDLLLIADVCLCEYTSHGHCGLIKEGKILNDATLELLSRSAVSYAKAGADIIAPSDMMDGRVKAIRGALDDNGFENVIIMAYSAKYSSAFYGPFREAAHSAPSFGDRKTYQMDYGNLKEALREVRVTLKRC